MRVFARKRRERLARAFAAGALASILSGVVGGAVVHAAAAWIFPTAGLVGYAICSQRAMLCLQGPRRCPAPPRADQRAVEGLIAPRRARLRTAESIPR